MGKRKKRLRRQIEKEKETGKLKYIYGERFDMGGEENARKDKRMSKCIKKERRKYKNKLWKSKDK